MKLTETTVKRLPLADDQGKADVIYFDDDLKGFGIRFRAGGKSTWLIQYRDAAGNTRRNTIGDARKLEIDKARIAAKTRLATVTLGGDPQAEKVEARARAKLTLGILADRYLEFKRPRLRASTYNADKRYLTKHWRPLHGLPVHTVTRRDVASRLGELVKEHGSTAAERARETLNGFFGWAIREGIADANPVIGTNHPLEGNRARDRVLTEDEIRTVWNACRDDDFGRIVRLLLLTAARRDEVGGLRRTEADIERGTLSIPGERTKNGHPLMLTLPPLAISILEAVPRREGRDFFFGVRGGAFSAWSYSMLALSKRIAESGEQLSPWRIHDIRRSVATHMAEIGVQPHIIEAVLNHRGGHKAGVAGIYNRASYEREIKAALALWAYHLQAIVEGRETNIVPLRA